MLEKLTSFEKMSSANFYILLTEKQHPQAWLYLMDLDNQSAVLISPRYKGEKVFFKENYL